MSGAPQVVDLGLGFDEPQVVEGGIGVDELHPGDRGAQLERVTRLQVVAREAQAKPANTVEQISLSQHVERPSNLILVGPQNPHVIDPAGLVAQRELGLVAHERHRLLRAGDNQHLVEERARRLVSAQPVVLLGLVDEQQIEVGPLHVRARAREAILVLGERGGHARSGSGHSHPPVHEPAITAPPLIGIV